MSSRPGDEAERQLSGKQSLTFVSRRVHFCALAKIKAQGGQFAFSFIERFALTAVKKPALLSPPPYVGRLGTLPRRQGVDRHFVSPSDHRVTRNPGTSLVGNRACSAPQTQNGVPQGIGLRVLQRRIRQGGPPAVKLKQLLQSPVGPG